MRRGVIGTSGECIRLKPFLAHHVGAEAVGMIVVAFHSPSQNGGVPLYSILALANGQRNCGWSRTQNS
jgi:hypothetical protein